MKSFSILSSAVFLASTVVAKAIPNPETVALLPGPVIPNEPLPPVTDLKPPNQNCVVPLVIFESLGEFVLDIKTQKDIDTTPVGAFKKVLNPLKFETDSSGVLGNFTPVIGGHGGKQYPLRMDQEILKLVIPQKIPSPLGFIAVPIDRFAYRALKFKSNAPNPAKFSASYSCKTGVSWLELRTHELNSVFCTANNKLYIKEKRIPDSICLTVHPIVHQLPPPKE